MNVGYRDLARVVVDCIKMQDIVTPVLKSQLALIKLYADHIPNFKHEEALAHCRDEIYQAQMLPGIIRAEKIEGYLQTAFVGAMGVDPCKIDEQMDRLNNPPRLYAVPESKAGEPSVPDVYRAQPAFAAYAL